MKKVLAAALVLGLVSCFSAPASAEDASGNVPDTVLQDLGLGGLDTITDAEGEEIRGTFHLQVLAAATFFNKAINAQISRYPSNSAPAKVLTKVKASANTQYLKLYLLGLKFH